MEYEGMTTEEVASGIKGGNKGSTSTVGAGAGAAAAFFLVALFLDFFMVAAAMAPRQAHTNAATRIHNQRDM